MIALTGDISHSSNIEGWGYEITTQKENQELKKILIKKIIDPNIAAGDILAAGLDVIHINNPTLIFSAREALG